MRRCRASQAMGDAVRKPWETAVPVAQANRRRASASLDDVPHRPRLPSYPAVRLPDLYGSLSALLGMSSARASACGRPAVPFTAPGTPPAREVSPGPAASVSRATRRERNGLRRYGLTIRVLPLKSRTRGREYPRNRARRQDAGKRTVWMILWAASV